MEKITIIYFLVILIFNSLSAQQSSGTRNIPCPGTPVVKDIDGNTYNTVQIGSQCWMKENLKVSKYNDGTEIPLDTTGGKLGNASSEKSWTKINTGARTIYGNIAANLTAYGYLYNYYAVKGVDITGSKNYKNICPTGWHVPKDAEWTILTNFLGENVAGHEMKVIENTMWNIPGFVAEKSSGFSALPGGYRNEDGTFKNIKNNASYWSAPDSENDNAWSRTLYFDNNFVYRDNNNENLGASLRCIRN
jgi:uncharacterized protein (TIGR02145 family)